jgi:hypothetical protein
MDSMGEPTSRMDVTPLARYLFMSWSPRSVARLWESRRDSRSLPFVVMWVWQSMNPADNLP